LRADVVPVAVLDEADDARPPGDALRAADMGRAEVTLDMTAQPAAPASGVPSS